MKAQGLSQAELARRVGLSQQAIGKLIHGNSRKTTSIVKLAHELGTTPAYLEGDTDDPAGEARSAPLPDSETRELNALLSAMVPSDRRAVLHIARSLIRRGGHADPLPNVSDLSENALTRMFEGLLATIDPKELRSQQALLLAKRLPIGLSQMRDLEPEPAPRVVPSRAPAKERVDQPTSHRAPT